MTTPKAMAGQMLTILHNDRDRLLRIDNYLHGKHDEPYMPDRADEEYKLLAKRAVMNMSGLLVGTPAQAMYVDGFRRGETPDEKDSKDQPRITSADVTPEWEHWQQSRLDARQGAVIRGALSYGHSFTVTEKIKGKILTRGLSALRTAALYEDPANDETPYAALTITAFPRGENKGAALMWDGSRTYVVVFNTMGDAENITVTEGPKHGAPECPVTRFAAWVDLEGRTLGVIEPMIPLQNRINQTVFDLLVAQTYGSFQVRTVTGMVPPQKMKPIYQKDEDGKVVYEDGKPVILDFEPLFNEDGTPVAAEINLNARRFMFAEDHEAKFGSLPGTSLSGYIDSIDMSIRHIAAISQTPPHYLLGQIANLSAEALTAAETALSRKVEEFKHSFGESWERVFRLAAAMAGDTGTAEDFHGEVIWRDMENRSLAQSADALSKLSDGLDIPKRGLWHRIPGATQSEIEMWEELADQEPEVALAMGIGRSALPTPAMTGSINPPTTTTTAPATKASTGNLTPKKAA